MTLSWLGRFLGVAAPPVTGPQPSPGLSQRVAELEEEVQYLAGAMKRLRGRVTGSVRNVESDGKDDERPVEPENEVGAARDKRLNDEIMARRRGLSRTG